MAKLTNWEKFKLLLWKNWILQWKNRRRLFFEIFVPPMFLTLLFLLRCLCMALEEPEHKYQAQKIDTLTLFNSRYRQRSQIDELVTKFTKNDLEIAPELKFEVLYSPQNAIFESLIEESVMNLGLDGFKGYKNSQELENMLVNDSYFAGVQFDDNLRNISTYPEKLEFSIRFPDSLRTSQKALKFKWFTSYLSPPLTVPGPRNPFDSDGGVPVGYLVEGFLPLQHTISMAYINFASNNSEEMPKVRMQRFPYPSYQNDVLLQIFPWIIPLFVLLSYMHPSSGIARSITLEKEKQLKEVMKIMGLPNWLHWSAWFTKYFISLGLSTFINLLILKMKTFSGVSIFTNSSWTLLLFFLLIYNAANICFCFMVAVFFKSANTAASVMNFISFLAYLPFMLLEKDLGTIPRLIYSLLANSALGFGVKIIFEFEKIGEGLRWSNLFKTHSLDENCSMGAVMLMMCLSCAFYMIICLYIEQIFPGDFGVAKKWNFPFKKTFWKSSATSRNIKVEGVASAKERTAANDDRFEPEPFDKDIGLQLKNLRKCFHKKEVVKGISINMYIGEISVLLGHNGAGKTTTISMITGMFPPSCGTVTVNGYDIQLNTDAARASMGICPQHNVLFEEMSAANHIVFYSRLRGLRGEEIENEVYKYMKLIELEKKADVMASTLSGGMKRKLSVCCALCGGTKVVLCDEPSSGMDPSARRQLWDLLQSEKSGRALLLTTHFMDEADLLGDRIGIMCEGELKCYGSSFFLKKRFGSGYRLVCVKRENCLVSEVTALLQKYIPHIKPESNIGSELSYLLPESYSTLFEDMLLTLEEKSAALNLDGHGVSLTTLEEVFLRVGVEEKREKSSKEDNVDVEQTDVKCDAPQDDEVDHSKGTINVESIQSKSNIFLENTQLVKGSKLFLNQWKAMFEKKFLYTKRNILPLLLQNIMPLLLIAFTIGKSHHMETLRKIKPMTISLKLYPSAVTVLSTGEDLSDFEQLVAKQYEKIAKSYGEEYHFQSTENDTFEDYILDIAESELTRFNSEYLAAATIEDGKIIAWLNNQLYHTAPLTVNMVHNALAKAAIGPKAEIVVTNAPLQDIREQNNEFNHLLTDLGIFVAINLSFCMCFISAFYSMFVIKERESRAKLLQFVCGTQIWIYWFTQFLWDLLTFMITVLVIMLSLKFFQQIKFTQLGGYWIVCFVFGIAMLPYTYILSFFSKEPSNGFAKISLINTFTGLAVFLLSMAIRPLAKTMAWTKHIDSWFRVFPHFCFSSAVEKIYTTFIKRKLCDQLPENLRCSINQSCCESTSFLGWKHPGILPEIVYMLTLGVLYFMIIILQEYQFINDIVYKVKELFSKPPPPPPDMNFDVDVDREKRRVIAMSTSEIEDQNLVLHRVSKYYDTFLAVNQISLCVKSGECFGLLGVNGAGKTSTFKMMTGDERITFGNAYVKGSSLRKNISKIYKDIGYCPQFDALLDDLTGRDMLKIFCLIRGIPKSQIVNISEELANSFGFQQHIDKLTCTFSGGNKRKLSAALAVIGSPSLIFLDEPTTGMDPGAKRQFWNMICRIRDAGKSIILTSHSMEECEALCTRLAIMVNGEFKCIGSTQHLKNRFSKGLILKIKVLKKPQIPQHYDEIAVNLNISERPSSPNCLEERINNIKNFVRREFISACLQDEYQGMLTYFIGLDARIRWSKVFGTLERNRVQLFIEDYSISQTSLEEIFLEFAKLQREDIRVINLGVNICSCLL